MFPILFLSPGVAPPGLRFLKANSHHDPKTGRFASSGRTPQMRAEKRGLRALYGHTLKNPLAAPDSMLVHLTADELRVAMAKGPALDGGDGSVIVQGKHLKREHGTHRGWGMVKVIWKHGERSRKARSERVTLSDVLALPEVIRSTPTTSPKEAGREVYEWKRGRHDGRTVVYAVTKFGGDDHSHVVSIHVEREGQMQKSGPSLAEELFVPKRRIPAGWLSVASPAVGSLASEYTRRKTPVKPIPVLFVRAGGHP